MCPDWRDWQEATPNLTDAAQKCLVNGKYCKIVDRLQLVSSLRRVVWFTKRYARTSGPMWSSGWFTAFATLFPFRILANWPNCILFSHVRYPPNWPLAGVRHTVTSNKARPSGDQSVNLRWPLTVTNTTISYVSDGNEPTGLQNRAVACLFSIQCSWKFSEGLLS